MMLATPPPSSSPSPSPSNPSKSASSLPALSELFFPAAESSVPLVSHGQHYHLTSAQCISIGKTLEYLHENGYSSSPHYTTLLNIFHFILKLHQAVTGRNNRTFALGRQIQQQMGGRFELFTQTQYKQMCVQIKVLSHLLQNHPMPPNLLAAVKAFNIKGNVNVNTTNTANATSFTVSPSNANNNANPNNTATPAPWTTNPTYVDLVNGIVKKMSDPCTALVESLSGKLTFANLPSSMLSEARDNMVDREIGERLRAIEAESIELGRYKQTNEDSLLEAKKLRLAALQRKVRLAVLSSIPAEVIDSKSHRSKREIELEHRRRDKIMKAARAKEDKEQRKSRKIFLTALLNHSREFSVWHREKRRLCKRNGDAVLKEFEEREKRRLLESKAAEKERLAALKENNEQEYIRLLKKAKNERLLTLIRQTDAYMTNIGIQLQQEQKRREEEKGELANGWEARNRARDRRSAAATAGATNVPVSTRTEEEEYDSMLSSRQKYYDMAHSVQEQVKQPTSMVAGELRSYQLAGLQWLVSLYNNQLNGILADEMGLGKTVQTCALIAYLMEHKSNYGPFLIIVPMSTLHNNWEYEFDRWFPSCAKVIYDGNKEERKAIREKHIIPQNFNVLITTFEFAMRDKSVLRQVPWEYIIIDEAHRLKNPKCKLALELATYPLNSRRIALTGTPLQNELPELWSLLNFLHPVIFNSCDSFEKWFSSPFAAMGVNVKNNPNNASTTANDPSVNIGMTEEEKLLVINRLHAILRPFMLRREKREVEKDLADKVEKVLRCELTPYQRLLYSAIIEGTVSLHNRMVQLRKVCNHPYLFHPYTRNLPHSSPYPIDDSIINLCGKFKLLDSILPKLKRCGHRVLLFNQMTKTMNVMEDYFKLKGYEYLRLDGTTPAAERQESLQQFNSPDSKYFIFILSTKAGGLGLNLQSADTVILFDSDWNPQNDLQAQARAHRIGQKQQVLVLRFITTGTIEEKVLATAHTKLSHEAMVIQAGMFNEKYSHTTSREMVTKAMREKREAEAEADGDDDEGGAEDEIIKAIARSEQELELYKSFEQENHATTRSASAAAAAADSAIDLYVPSWLYQWCVLGPRSTSCETNWVKCTPKQLIRDRNNKTLALGRASGSGFTNVGTKIGWADLPPGSVLDEEDEELAAEMEAAMDAADDGKLTRAAKNAAVTSMSRMKEEEENQWKQDKAEDEEDEEEEKNGEASPARSRDEESQGENRNGLDYSSDTDRKGKQSNVKGPNVISFSRSLLNQSQAPLKEKKKRKKASTEKKPSQGKKKKAKVATNPAIEEEQPAPIKFKITIKKPTPLSSSPSPKPSTDDETTEDDEEKKVIMKETKVKTPKKEVKRKKMEKSSKKKPNPKKKGKDVLFKNNNDGNDTIDEIDNDDDNRNGDNGIHTSNHYKDNGDSIANGSPDSLGRGNDTDNELRESQLTLSRSPSPLLTIPPIDSITDSPSKSTVRRIPKKTDLLRVRDSPVFL